MFLGRLVNVADRGAARGRGADTRDRLIAAAAEVFIEHGIARSSLEEISRRAGYTRGAFHWHFSTKEELLLAVLRDRLAQRIAATDLVALATNDLREFNREQRATTRSFAAGDRRGWALLLLEFWLTAARDPGLLAEAAALKAEARSAIERQLTQLAAASNFTLPVPSTTMAAALIALEDGFALQELLDTDVVPPTMLWDVIDYLTTSVIGAPTRDARDRT